MYMYVYVCIYTHIISDHNDTYRSPCAAACVAAGSYSYTELDEVCIDRRWSVFSTHWRLEHFGVQPAEVLALDDLSPGAPLKADHGLQELVRSSNP